MTVEPVLDVRNLYTEFPTREGVVKAVNGVNLTLKRGTILGNVGDSGCGKTMTAHSILSHRPFPGHVTQGQIFFNGHDLLKMGKEEMRRLRGKEIAMVFQDAVSGLNPVLPVGAQVEEMVTSHVRVSRREARKLTMEVLQRVGMADPERVVNQYPFQLSGGMCQRIMLAIALVLEPQVLIADEATTNLDVTLQADILAQLRRLKAERDSSIIIISHDLGVIARMADEVAVMYAGHIVEQADTVSIFHKPAHPYTSGLLQAVTRLDRPGRHLTALPGMPPSLVDLPDQCAFIPRCHKARNECRLNPHPPLREREPGHMAACYNPVLHDWD
ncbi:MAG: ABC transporter ATP-binding protein [Dehalococcoidia bacterium]|nr:ABC transporter ATP-binding protein [Dehalococcoidia bacterium]